MKTILLSSMLAVLVLAAGCAQEAATDPSASNKVSADGKANSSSAELSKCELCGTEVPKAELTMHDGKMACKACMAAHQH